MALSNINNTDWFPQAYEDRINNQVNNAPDPTDYITARDLYIKANENAPLLQAFLNGTTGPINSGNQGLRLIHDDGIDIPTLGYGLNLTARSTAEAVDILSHIFDTTDARIANAIELVT